MDKRLEANMRFLCDESRMLTGITVAYGTTTYSEWAQYGRAQEIDRVENGFIPAVRPLIPDTIYDLASLTKLFTAVVTLALVESGQLSLCFDNESADADVLSRAAADIYAIYALWQGFAAELEENGQHKLYYDIELPLVKVLADMQYTGVAVDRGALEEFGKRLSGGIAELENSIYELAGEKFNINSPNGNYYLMLEVESGATHLGKNATILMNGCYLV